MDEIRKRAFKKAGMVLVLLCVLSLFKAFCPETIKAGTYDNAYTFYQKYGNEMAFLPGQNNQGEIYYATKAKKDEKTGIKYTTLGWKVRVFDSAGALVETIYYKLGGKNMCLADVCTKNGYEYCLYQVTLTNMKSRMSKAGLKTLQNPNSNIIFDACTTTKLEGVVQGGMTDKGPSWGKVYTTYNGIVNAQKWSAATKETLKSYYNKNVEGLFYDVTLSKGKGISKVKGAGKYCFGTKVSISADLEEGYHFSKWVGDKTFAEQNYSFVLYGNNVDLKATAVENTYKVVFDSSGGKGNIPTQILKFGQSLLLPTEGFWMEDAALCGWRLFDKKGTTQYVKGQSVSVKELVKKLQLQKKDGATIVLYAGWDSSPLIKTTTIYVSLKDATEGRITEAWLGERAQALDQEDGEIPYGRNARTSFFMENYQMADFTELREEGNVTEIFCAVDSVGNKTRKEVNVYVTDTHLYSEDEVFGRVRFISEKYFMNENGDLIEEEKGGLAEDSVWRVDKAYRVLLEQLFQLEN